MMHDEDLEEEKKLLTDMGYDLSDEELMDFAVRLAKAARDFVPVADVVNIHYYDSTGEEIFPDEDIFKILPVLHRFPKDLL